MNYSTHSSDPARLPLAPAKAWRKPEFRKLEAGAAEASGHAGNDGTTNQS